MSNLANGRLGFSPREEVFDHGFDQKIDRTATEAARRKFTPEFMNRIDKVVVFKTLRSADLQQILDLELEMVQQRILAASGSRKFLFGCSESVKNFLVEEGTDAMYGARHLKRAIEKNLVSPLANSVATAQLKFGDFVRVDLDLEGHLIFTKETEAAVSRIPDLGENDAGVSCIAALAEISAASLLGYGAF